MLRNPGCEEGAHQQTRYWTPEGGPFTDQFDNIWPPIGWQAWWIDRRVNDGSPQDQKTGRPEFHTLTVPPFPDPVRLRSGQKFAKLHTFFRTHYAGWLQQVAVTAGRTYRFSIYAHSWYSDCSYKPHAIPLLDDCNTPASDSHDILQVGIGPAGPERSPLDADIVWSAPVEIYGGYKDALTVEAVAEAGTITVWLRSWTNYALHHEDVYFDDARLVVVDTPPPMRTYARTYVLLPNNHPFQPSEQVRISALHPGQTVGPSADDAAIPHPNLTEVHIISYQPQTWGGKEALEAFWFKYYDFPQGGDSLEYREDDAPPPAHPYLLWQRDPEWKDIGFGDGNCHSTIGQQGCFITDLAMAQRFYGIQDDATPLSVDEALGPAGYSGCIANWVGNNSHFEAQLQISISGSGSTVQALEHIDAGGCAMIEIEPASLEHFVLAIGYRHRSYGGGDIEFDVLDPSTNTQYWMPIEKAQSWRILTHVEEPPPPATDTTARISLHLQTMIPGVKEFLQTARPASVKRVTGMQDLQTMRGWAPWIETVYRHDGNPEGALQFCDPQGRVTAESLRCAGDWLATYQDSLVTVSTCGLWSVDDPFYMEGPNEFGWAAGDLDSIQRAASFERSWLIKLGELGLPVAPITFCAGVGNIGRPGQEEQDFLLLVPLAKETAAMGGGFGLHCYWTPYKLAEGWKYLAGRYQWIDRVLEENGVRGLKWFLGEGGVAGVVGNPSPTSRPGWRAPDSYNGNWDTYLTDILEWNRRTQGWNSTHGNRCRVLSLFTSGIGNLGWDSFLLNTEEINALAIALTT